MYGIYAVYAGSVSIRFISHTESYDGACAEARNVLENAEYAHDDRWAWLGTPSLVFLTEDNEDEQVTGPVVATFLPAK